MPAHRRRSPERDVICCALRAFAESVQKGTDPIPVELRHRLVIQAADTPTGRLATLRGWLRRRAAASRLRSAAHAVCHGPRRRLNPPGKPLLALWRAYRAELRLLDGERAFLTAVRLARIACSIDVCEQRARARLAELEEIAACREARYRSGARMVALINPMDSLIDEIASDRLSLPSRAAACS